MSSDEGAALLEWLRTFGVSVESVGELKSGIALNTVLCAIEAQHFGEETVDGNINADNWVMCEGNLRRLARALDVAYREVLGVNMSGPIEALDLEAAAQAGSERELVALTELVLGLAVQCESKQTHVAAIMGMSKDVQVRLMVVIKRIMEQSSRLAASPAELAAAPPAHVERADERARSGVDAEEAAKAAAKVFALENEVADLKDALAAAARDADAAGLKAHEARKQVEELELHKEQASEQVASLEATVAALEAKVKAAGAAAAESAKAEVARAQEQIVAADEKSARAEALVRERDGEIAALKTRVASLVEVEEAYAELKDESDALRTGAAKADKLERQLAKYKERIAGLGDLKKQMDELQEENDRNVQKLGDAAAKAARASHLESQIADYREQLTAAESKLNAKTLETERLEAKLAKSKDALKAAAHDAELLRAAAASGGPATDGLAAAPDGPVSDLFTADLQHRVRKLEEENRMLRASAAGQGGDANAALQSMQEVLERVQLARDTLQEELTAATRALHAHEDTIEELEAKLAAASSSNLGSELEADKARMALESLAKAERALEAKSAEAAEATKDAADAKRELATTREALERVQQTNVSLESKLSLVGADQASMLEAVQAQAQAEMDAALAAERSAAAAQLDDYKAEAARADAAAAAAEDTAAALKSSLEDAEARAAASAAELASVAAERNAALKAKAAMADEVLAAKAEVSAKDAELAAAAAASATLTGRIELLEHTSSASAGSSEEAAALRAQMAASVEKVHKLELELAAANSATETQRVRCEGLADRADAATARVAELQSQLASLQAGAAASAGALPSSAAQHLNDTITQLQAQVAAKDKEVKFFKTQFHQAKDVFTRENQLVTTAFYNLGLELQRLKSQSRVAVETGGALAAASSSAAAASATTGSRNGWINRKRS